MNWRTTSARVSAAARLFAGALALACCQAGAELAVPPLTGRVVDRAGMLAGADAQRVDQAIRDLEQATGGQMAVLTLPSLTGDSLERFSMQVAENWRIGHAGKDDGAVLLLVRDSHDIRLEIGRGWEGPVNDARAGDIIRGMAPFFRAGRFGDGTVYAVQRLQGFVTGKAPAGMPAPPGGTDDYLSVGGLRIHPLWLFAGWIVFIIVVGLLSRRFGGRTYGGRSHGGSFGGFSGGGGGFSGGGGSFSGGGASGRW